MWLNVSHQGKVTKLLTLSNTFDSFALKSLQKTKQNKTKQNKNKNKTKNKKTKTKKQKKTKTKTKNKTKQKPYEFNRLCFLLSTASGVDSYSRHFEPNWTRKLTKPL